MKEFFPKLLGAFIVVSLLIALAYFVRTGSEDVSEGEPSHASLDGTLEKIELENKDLSLTEIDKCLDSKLSDDWENTDYNETGSFYSKTWCRGMEDEEECTIGNVNNNGNGRQGVRLGTYFEQDGLPKVFGIAMDFLSTSSGDNITVSANYSFGAKTQNPDSYDINFINVNIQGAEGERTVSLRTLNNYTVSGETVTLKANIPANEEFTKLITSVENFKSVSLEQMESLENEVRNFINSGEATICDEIADPRSSISNCMNPRELTEEEKAQEQSKAKEYFESQKSIINEKGDQLFQVLKDSFPFEECWNS